jgi:hypothetical protein
MARPTTIILIGGEAGAGKDTAADMIIEHCGSQYVPAMKVALADRLKRISRAIIAMFTGVTIPIGDFYDEDKKRAIRDDIPMFNGQPFCIRSVLQNIGTEIFRDMISPDIWCDIMRRDFIRPGGFIIISDCRFPNEIAYFSRLPNVICMSIRINRPHSPTLPAINAAHRSETGVNTLVVDHIIENDSTLDDFRDRIIKLVTPLVARHAQMLST